MNLHASFFSVSLFCLILLLVGACQSESAPPVQETSAQETSYQQTQLERQVYDLVNAHRRKLGLSPLSYSDDIAATARHHSRAMANHRTSFSHQGADKRQQQIAGQIAFRRFAENIAMNTYSASQAGQQALHDWLSSPGHRAAIEGNFNQTGIGVAQDGAGSFYFTQIFVLTP